MSYVARYLNKHLSSHEKQVIARNMGFPIWNNDTSETIAYYIRRDGGIWNFLGKQKRDALISAIAHKLYNL